MKKFSIAVLMLLVSVMISTYLGPSALAIDVQLNLSISPLACSLDTVNLGPSSNSYIAPEGCTDYYNIPQITKDQSATSHTIGTAAPTPDSKIDTRVPLNNNLATRTPRNQVIETNRKSPIFAIVFFLGLSIILVTSLLHYINLPKK